MFVVVASEGTTNIQRRS